MHIYWNKKTNRPSFRSKPLLFNW